MKFIYCRRLNSQHFGAPKSGARKMRGLLVVAGIAGGVPTPLHQIFKQIGLIPANSSTVITVLHFESCTTIPMV